MAALREDWLKALAEEAAVTLGPIASVIVEQAAAEATSFDELPAASPAEWSRRRGCAS